MTRAIAGLALFGLAISAYLTWVHYAGIEPVCSSISNCERVQSSDYAELVGVPVALIGVVGYALGLALSALFDLPSGAIVVCTLAAIGLLYAVTPSRAR